MEVICGHSGNMNSSCVILLLQKSLLKVLKVLTDHHLPRCFPDDLPMYLLLVHKLLKPNPPSKHEVKKFVCHCVENVQSLDSGIGAKVVNAFLGR